MKTFSVFTVLLALSSACASAQTPATPPMRDATTHEQLVQVMRRVVANDPMRDLAPSTGRDPSTVNQPADLIASSDIICFGGMATIVPKRAILASPKNLQERIKFQAGSKFLGWPDFFALNRGWITTVEVSRVQAEGNQPIDSVVTDRISKSTTLVVATYQGGPISVLPLKENKPAVVTADAGNTHEKSPRP